MTGVGFELESAAHQRHSRALAFSALAPPGGCRRATLGESAAPDAGDAEMRVAEAGRVPDWFWKPE